MGEGSKRNKVPLRKKLPLSSLKKDPPQEESRKKRGGITESDAGPCPGHPGSLIRGKSRRNLPTRGAKMGSDRGSAKARSSRKGFTYVQEVPQKHRRREKKSVKKDLKKILEGKLR